MPVPGRGELAVHEQPTYTQLAGTRLAYFIGSIIAVITGLITLYWIFGFQHPAPVLPVPLPTDPAILAQVATDYNRIVTDYRSLAEAHQARVIDFFDAAVARTLLPVLTAILGYIFGVQRPAAGRSPPNS